FLSCHRHAKRSTLFPYTTLFRSAAKAHRLAAQPNIIVIESDDQPTIAFNHQAMPKTFRRVVDHGTVFSQMVATPPLCCPSRAALDRKSTRLNSSHQIISYAVFCL